MCRARRRPREHPWPNGRRGGADNSRGARNTLNARDIDRPDNADDDHDNRPHDHAAGGETAEANRAHAHRCAAA